MISNAAFAEAVYHPPGANLTYGDVTHGQQLQSALLSVVRNDGYARAWLGTDIPFQFGSEFLGGAWTFGVGYSGNSKAFGVSDQIEFDQESARIALEEWFNTIVVNRPEIIELSSNVLLNYDAATNGVSVQIKNDSSLVSKSTRLSELNFGYSDFAWGNEHGSLFLGVEAHIYAMGLSRLSVRFGDITNPNELFDQIRTADFRNDTRLGLDVGALWVAENYQLGAQITNFNEPKFQFPDVNLGPYTSQRVIDFLQQDRTYKMDRQLKLEGSVFTADRRWSAHLGVAVDPATDPLGDDYQWLTASVGYKNEGCWVPSVRLGLRENLAGTRRRYAALGATFFKIVNFDIASSFVTVRIDGQELPQGLMASIGFQISW